MWARLSRLAALHTAAGLVEGFVGGCMTAVCTRFWLLGLVVCGVVSGSSAAVAGWDETIDRVAPSVVVLRVVVPRAFDGGAPGYSTATGFVVDAERGLILTNRHVVHPGPVRAQAVFLNNEEVEVTAVYRDPVHDFGFFQFVK